jgi:hypothetical protein
MADYLSLLFIQGRFEECLKVSESTISHIETYNYNYILPSVLYFRALAAKGLGQYRQAETWLVETQEKAEQLGQLHVYSHSLVGRAEILQENGKESEAYDLVVNALRNSESLCASDRIELHGSCTDILISQKKFQYAEEILLNISNLIEKGTPTLQHHWFHELLRISVLSENSEKILKYALPAIALDLPVNFEQEQQHHVEVFLYALFDLHPYDWRDIFEQFWNYQKAYLIPCKLCCALAEEYKSIDEEIATMRFLGMAKAKREELTQEEQIKLDDWLSSEELRNGVDIATGEWEMRERSFSPLSVK